MHACEKIFVDMFSSAYTAIGLAACMTRQSPEAMSYGCAAHPLREDTHVFPADVAWHPARSCSIACAAANTITFECIDPSSPEATNSSPGSQAYRNLMTHA